jgi:hypothetical protein
VVFVLNNPGVVLLSSAVAFIFILHFLKTRMGSQASEIHEFIPDISKPSNTTSKTTFKKIYSE